MTTETLIALAVEALRQALDGEPVEARETVDRIARMTDDEPEVLREVIAAWVDGVGMGLGWEPGTVLDLGVTSRSADGAEIDSADLPGPAVWAGRVVVARVARDDDQLKALIFGLFAAPDTVAENLATLLDMLATTLAVHRGLVPAGADDTATAVAPDWQTRAADLRANADLN